MEIIDKLILGIIVCILSFSTVNGKVMDYLDLDDDFESICINFRFDDPIVEKINVNNVSFTRVSIDDLSNSFNIGQPCLPVKPVKLLLPRDRTVRNIKVSNNERISLGKGYNVELGGNVVPLSHLRNFQVKDDSSLTIFSDDEVSNSIYSQLGIFIYRGFNILHLNLFPVQYVKETGELFYFNNLKVLVETDELLCNRGFRGIERDYELVRSIVDNPDYVESYIDNDLENILLSNETYEYVIITNNKFKNSDGEYTFQDLIDHKLSKGLNSKIVTVEEIMSNPDFEVSGKWGDANPFNPFYLSEITGNLELFDDKSARIRNFIRYAYSELGTSYVLLGGDADVANEEDNIIPLRGLFANESGLPLNSVILDEEENDIPSDVYYACLDGNFNYDCDEHFGESADRNDVAEIDEADLYSEVWVGRACVDSKKEVSNFVMKTLEYELNSDAYFSEILFVGEYLGNLFYFPYGGDYKDMIEPYIPSQYNLHKLYDSPDNHWYPEDFVNELYDIEPHIINHDGHGSCHYMLKMYKDSFYEFENEKHFFIYSHSCLTGSFDNWDPWSGHNEEDCIAEILTCEIPYGAFACILNARYGLGSEDIPEAPSGAYDESFFKKLFDENIKELGGASHGSKEDNVWRINDNGYRWCYYQTNLFGDPELSIKDPGSSAPYKPNKPTGKTNGKIGKEYLYSTSTTDPKDSMIWYWFDWGDNTNSGWIGPYESGVTVEAGHVWEIKNNYEIRVKAKNQDDIQSEWSDPLYVSMPKAHQRINVFFSHLLMWLKENFPILEILFVIP